MSRLTRDGTAKNVSRCQTRRRERGQGSIVFLCSPDNEQDWQPYPVDPYFCYMCDHISLQVNFYVASNTLYSSRADRAYGGCPFACHSSLQGFIAEVATGTFPVLLFCISFYILRPVRRTRFYCPRTGKGEARFRIAHGCECDLLPVLGLDHQISS